MAQKQALEDIQKRNRVLRVLADGGTIQDAAAEIGVSHMSLHRYRRRHADYDQACQRALEEGSRVSKGGPTRTPGVQHPGVPVTKSKPSTVPPEVREVAAELDVDPDIVHDLERHIESDVELPSRSGPKLTLRAYMDLLWERASSERKDASQWARLLAPVMFGPVIRDQERRADAEALARQRELAEQLAMGESGDDRPASTGMTVLEVPPNKARPHIARAVEAEVVGMPGRPRK